MTQDQPSSIPDTSEPSEEPAKTMQRDMALHVPPVGVGAKIGTSGSAAQTPAHEITPAMNAPHPSESAQTTASNREMTPDMLAHRLNSSLAVPAHSNRRLSDLSAAPSAADSNQATAGNSTPATDTESDAEAKSKRKAAPLLAAQGARPGEVQPDAPKPSYIKPITAPGSPDYSSMPSRVSTMASEPESGDPKRNISPLGGPSADPSAQQRKPNARSPSTQGAHETGKHQPDLRSASPNKINGRPAVFSAIPRDKDKEASHQHHSKERPGVHATGEKKSSVLGKMFGAMKSSEHLGDGQHGGKEHKDKQKRGRSRGDAHGESGYDSESGTESDASVASAASARTERSDKGGFLKLTRKASGGNKKDAYAGSEQEKAAALAASRKKGKEGADGHPADEGSRPPPLSRRSSEKKHDRTSESGSVAGSIGQSLKDMVTGPLMQRKPSLHSNRSYDGRSEHGDEHEDSPSRKGGTTTSLLKKYGACEKVAIGRGATAVVRLAHKWDKSTEKLYAVKEFRKRRKNESEKDYVKKLTSEFCISSTLHHANIVETVDLVQDENHHWCEVMEYCPNGDLYAAIKKGDLSQTQINTYFQQMVSGVAYLHSMGVAHRDIKPENLLLDAHNVIKITDFGVSDVFRMCWEKTCHLSRGLCGSEPYIAPEQFEPKAQYDARLVDVWACAIVYYCMQFQELPWRIAKLTDPSFATFAEAYHTTNSPPPLGDIHPRECRVLIKHMLSPNPKERITAESIVSSNKWFQSLLPSGASATGSNSEKTCKDPIAGITVPPPPSAPVVKELLNR